MVEKRRGSHLSPGEFYGEVLSAERLAGLRLSEVRHARPSSLPTHEHELAFLCLVLEGEYAEQYGSRTLACRPSSVVFHPPAFVHRDRIGERGGRFFIVELERQWMERSSEGGLSLAAASDLPGGEMRFVAGRLYREFRAIDGFSPLAMEGLVLELLALLGRAGRGRREPEPGWLRRARDLLHDLQDDPEEGLTIARIASEVGVHPVHLARAFRKRYGMSPGDYARRLRIQKASRLLSLPGARIADVALACGFSDQSHFTRAFKRSTGTTPRRFRSALGLD